jgi:transcription antitermination factor NusA-like protein
MFTFSNLHVIIDLSNKTKQGNYIMKLTTTEMTRISALMAKASSEDLNTIADMFNHARRAKIAAIASSFTVGDKVTWNGKYGNKITGTIEKVNRKNIIVKVSPTEVYNVTATLLKKA